MGKYDSSQGIWYSTPNYDYHRQLSMEIMYLTLLEEAFNNI